MIDLVRDIHSLSDFKRNTSDFTRKLKETGQPLVLTVNGKAELIVQDAASYQALVEAAAAAAQVEAIESIRRGLEQTHRGDGIALEEAFAQRRVPYETE